MSDNPLAGISIPSLSQLIEDSVERLGTRIIDLENPLQRRRLIQFLQQSVGHALTSELERAIEAAQTRATAHVFRMMRDPDYQEKKRRAQESRAKQKAELRAEKENAEREARMDYSRKNLAVSKPTVQ